MSVAKDSSTLVARVKETYGLTLATSYIERICKAHADLSEEELYILALNEDLSDVTDRSVLPFGITSQAKGVIPEDIVLQVKSVRDATQPLVNNSIATLLTVRAMERSNNLNDKYDNSNDKCIEDEEYDDNDATNNFSMFKEDELQRYSNNNTANQERNVEIHKDKICITLHQRESRKRLLKFVLTDGHSEITAVELHTSRSLTKKIPLPGEKVLVKANAEIRSGVIVIDDDHFIFAGGQVNQLAQEYRTVQQRLTKNVERASLLEEKRKYQLPEQKQLQQQQEYIMLSRKKGLEGAPLFTPLQLNKTVANTSHQVPACTAENNNSNSRNTYQHERKFSDRSSFKNQSSRYNNNYKQQQNYNRNISNNNSRGRQEYEREEHDYRPPSYSKNSYYEKKPSSQKDTK